MWCTCIKNLRQTGYVRQPDSDLWVHSLCMLPSKQMFEKVTDMRSPRNTECVLSTHGRSDGVTEVRWVLKDKSKVTTLAYHPYPRKVDMDQGREILQQAWGLLDECINEIKVVNNPSAEYYKAAGRAYANVLAIMMKPFFTEPDEVVREGLRRWAARHDGNTSYETPGLAESIWDPQKNWDGSNRILPNAGPGGSVRPAAQPTTQGRSLTADETIAVKNALANGMFTVDQLAGMFKTTTDVIEQNRG